MAFWIPSRHCEPPYLNLMFHILFTSVWWSVLQGRGRRQGQRYLCVVASTYCLFNIYISSIFSVLTMVGVSCPISETFRPWFFQIVSVLGTAEHSGCLFSSAWNLVHWQTVQVAKKGTGGQMAFRLARSLRSLPGGQWWKMIWMVWQNPGTGAVGDRGWKSWKPWRQWVASARVGGGAAKSWAQTWPQILGLVFSSQEASKGRRAAVIKELSIIPASKLN